jgi:hypothetical protein
MTFWVDPAPDLDPRIHASLVDPDPDSDPDADPDPSIFINGLQSANKKFI